MKTPPLWIALALAIAALLAAVWAAAWPIWRDFPLQLEAALGPVTMVAPAFRLPVRALAAIAPAATAGKLWLSLAVAALPIGAALLAAQLGRSPWLALFAVPLALPASLALGDAPWVGALAVTPFALWAIDRALAQPSVKRAAIAAALLALAPLLHPLPALVIDVCALALAVAHPEPRRRIALALACLAPSLPLVWLAYRALPQSEAHRIALLERLAALPDALVLGWTGDGALRIAVALLVLWLALLGTARTDGRDTEARQGGRPFRLELCAAIALAFVLCTPARAWRAAPGPSGTGLLPLAALLIALTPHGAIAGRRRLWMVPVLALALAHPLYAAGAAARFDRKLRPFGRLLAAIHKGQTTLVLQPDDLKDPDVDPRFEPWANLPRWIALATDAPRVDATFDPEQPETASHWDWVLTRGEPIDYSRLGPNGAGIAALTLSDKRGDWRLYQVRH
jgi:hypothetical protein